MVYNLLYLVVTSYNNIKWKEKFMKTLEEIHQIREQKRKELDLRVNIKADTREKHILVCLSLIHI